MSDCNTADGIDHGDCRIEECIWAMVERYEDGYILCPILWSGGKCEECMEILERGRRMKWKNTGRSVMGNGESTIYYESDDGQWLIESRKRAIPHAGGRSGYWMHTTYWLINADNLLEQKEFYSLKDAKAAAEVKE